MNRLGPGCLLEAARPLCQARCEPMAGLWAKEYAN
jgi:hypothetical protein